MKQQQFLRQEMARLNMNSEQLADAIQVSLYTVRSWLLHEGSAAHRKMPGLAKMAIATLKPRPKGKKAKA